MKELGALEIDPALESYVRKSPVRHMGSCLFVWALLLLNTASLDNSQVTGPFTQPVWSYQITDG